MPSKHSLLCKALALVLALCLPLTAALAVMLMRHYKP